MRKIQRLIFTGICCSLASFGAIADGDADLIGIMDNLQRFAHKAGLALDQDNRTLVAFYTHEMRETLAELQEVEEYNGEPIGELSRSMLAPALKRFEKAAVMGELDPAKVAYEGMYTACNACHQVTGYEFIKIEHNPANPYAQNFQK